MSINVGRSVVMKGKKTITKEQLDEVIKEHGLWLKDHAQGKRAELKDYSFDETYGSPVFDLSGVNLSNADLSGSSFFKSILVGINLSGAKLEGTHFKKVDLTDAVLDDIDIRDGSITYSKLTHVQADNADFTHCCMRDNSCENASFNGSRFVTADLYDSSFRGADLRNCNLMGANIDHVHFENADLSCVNLEFTEHSYWAYFNGADMLGIDIDGTPIDDEAVKGAKNLFVPMVCPEEGSFIAWKKCRDARIVKLQVTENALRTGGSRYFCRASEVMVLEVFDSNGKCDEAVSIDDETLIYRKGELVKDEEEFDPSLLHDGAGIHFFITRAEAERSDLGLTDEEIYNKYLYI